MFFDNWTPCWNNVVIAKYCFVGKSKKSKNVVPRKYRIYTYWWLQHCSSIGLNYCLGDFWVNLCCFDFLLQRVQCELRIVLMLLLEEFSLLPYLKIMKSVKILKIYSFLLSDSADELSVTVTFLLSLALSDDMFPCGLKTSNIIPFWW